MRRIRLGWMTALVVGIACLAAAASEPPGIRDIERLIVEGVNSVSLREVQAALRSDFDVALAAHPDASLSGFLRAIEATTLLGYRHSGFREAQIAAHFDEGKQRIIVRVTEGPRHVCGEVKIEGMKQASVAALLRALTEPAKKSSTPWVEDRPAPFDDVTAAEIRKRLKDALAEEGFFSPRITVGISTPADKTKAQLEIHVEEGVRAEIGQIEINGNERDSVENILQYLDLRSGQTYSSGLADRLKARLDESGRFVGATIDRAGQGRFFRDDREFVDLRIDVREYDAAPPLGLEFSAAEQAILKLRDWASRWSRGELDEDVVLCVTLGSHALDELRSTFHLPAAAGDADIAQVEIELILGPNRGELITMRAYSADGKLALEDALVLSKEACWLAAPQRRAKLEFAHPGKLQCEVSLETKATDDGGDKPFQFLIGMTLRTCDEGSVPLVARTRFSTASLLSLVHRDNPHCALRGEVWQIDSDAFEGQFDATTGRPVKVVSRSESKEMNISIRAEIGVLAEAIQTLRRRLADPQNVYPAATPWKSLLLFGLDECGFACAQTGAARERDAAFHALHTLVGRWSPPGLADLGWNSGSSDAKKTSFKLPPQKTDYDFEDLLKLRSQSGKNALAVLHEVYRRVVSPSGWLWPAGRDLILSFGADTLAPQARLWAAARSHELGPVGCWLIGSFASGWKQTLSEAGLNDLSLEAFRKDYQPLLAGESWLSKWILSLAEAARLLDEAELRALTALAGEDKDVRDVVRVALLRLKESAGQPVAEPIAALLDRIWQDGLSTVVRTALLRLAPATELASRPILPGISGSAGSRESAVSDHLKAISDRQEELGNSLAPKPKQSSEKYEDTPVARQLKALGLGEEKK